MHVELPIASFICALLSLAPIPWHWRAGTVPTISIALWLFVSNIINGVNTIVWSGNFSNVAPVWCDISTKLILGANLALPASIFALCLHLERVSSIRQVSTDHSQKRRRQFFDAALCFGVPMIYMGLHYVVQGHRFDIIEDFGCRASIYVSVVSTFLIWVPPLFFSVGSFILSAMSFRNFWIRRLTFTRHLGQNSALTPSRYFRLMVMALVQMFWGLVNIAFSMWFSMRGGLRPWISWEDVHFNFSRVGVFPTLFIPKEDLLYTYLLWWTIPISTLLFFAFFSFGQDAMKEYAACYVWVKRVVLRQSRWCEKSTSKTDSLPSYVRSENISLPSLKKVDNKASFSRSQATLTTPVLPPPYKWQPPPSPTCSSVPSKIAYTASLADASMEKSECLDLESLTETTKSCSTHHYHSPSYS